MSSNPFELNIIASYRKAVGGIVPGYSGHVPGARDKYAYSKWGEVPPFGGCAAGIRESARAPCHLDRAPHTA